MEIVDTVLIPPDLEPGDWVLGWRYDCEESSQVWSSCSDVSTPLNNGERARRRVTAIPSRDLTDVYPYVAWSRYGLSKTGAQDTVAHRRVCRVDVDIHCALFCFYSLQCFLDETLCCSLNHDRVFTLLPPNSDSSHWTASDDTGKK